LPNRIQNGFVGVSRIFYNTSYIIFIVGILSAVFAARFETRKRKAFAVMQNEAE